MVTEAFLEIPQELRSEHPELYAVMVRAFGFDPETGQPAKNMV